MRQPAPSRAVRLRTNDVSVSPQGCAYAPARISTVFVQPPCRLSSTQPRCRARCLQGYQKPLVDTNLPQDSPQLGRSKGASRITAQRTWTRQPSRPCTRRSRSPSRSSRAARRPKLCFGARRPRPPNTQTPEFRTTGVEFPRASSRCLECEVPLRDGPFQENRNTKPRCQRGKTSLISVPRLRFGLVWMWQEFCSRSYTATSARRARLLRKTGKSHLANSQLRLAGTDL